MPLSILISKLSEKDFFKTKDGINEINWNSMFEDFYRIQRDKKEL